MLKYLRCLQEKLHVYSAKTQETEESAEFSLFFFLKRERNQDFKQRKQMAGLGAIKGLVFLLGVFSQVQCY